MRHDLIASNSVKINASPDKVWHGLTDPETIKEYLFGTNTVTDWKKGSEIIFKGEYQGHHYADHGQILENIPLEKLSYSYWSGFSGLDDRPENYSTITYLLSKLDQNTTELTWTQKGYPDESRHAHALKDMPEFLGRVKGIIER